MIGLDSNILIRLATRESPSQYALCRRLFEDELKRTKPGFVSLIALVELCWTLRRVYKYAAADVEAYVEGLLNTAVLAFERQAIVIAALDNCRRKKMDLADALIAAVCAAEGCSHTVTLDEAFAEAGEAVLLSAVH